MKYFVKVKKANRMFNINNQIVRSPFQCFIDENYLPILQSKINTEGLSENDYSIETENEYLQNLEKKPKYNPSDRKPSKKRIQKQAIRKAFDQIDSNSPQIPPKQKQIKNDLKPTPKPKKNIKTKPEKNYDILVDMEQNIKDGVEVRIEELSTKSTTILEKFLNSEI